MNWDYVEWPSVYADGYSEELQEIVLHTYITMFTAFEDRSQTRQAPLKERYAAEESDILLQLIQWEEECWRHEREAIAAMSLALLACRTEELLDAMKHSFDHSHPPKERYEGKSKLTRRIKEYADRFSLDLTSITGFDSVREVILARNCCLHTRGEPDEAYRTETAGRFMDEFQRINLAPDLIKTVTKDLQAFASELAASMNQRKEKAARQSITSAG